MEQKIFTWLPFFEEMLGIICEKYDKKTLCDLLHVIFKGAGGLKDNFADGSTGPLKEVDPLTFIAYFNKQIADQKRFEHCNSAKKIFGLRSDVPSDFHSIPRRNFLLAIYPSFR